MVRLLITVLLFFIRLHATTTSEECISFTNSDRRNIRIKSLKLNRIVIHFNGKGEVRFQDTPFASDQVQISSRWTAPRQDVFSRVYLNMTRHQSYMAGRDDLVISAGVWSEPFQVSGASSSVVLVLLLTAWVGLCGIGVVTWLHRTRIIKRRTAQRRSGRTTCTLATAGLPRLEDRPRHACGCGGGSFQRMGLVALTLLSLTSLVLARCSGRADTFATITVGIPRSLNLLGVTVYFATSYTFNTRVDTRGWSKEGLVDLRAFDIDNVRPTTSPPCSPDPISCPLAWKQARAGCHPDTGECICTRGYKLVEGVCVACSRCAGPTFEAKQCLGREDTECFHVSRPFFDATNSIKEYQPMEDRYGFTVAHSPNLFLEDLLRTRTLSHSVRVGNRHQSNAFPWIRSSQLRLWVSVQDINLLPEYEDIEYESDNYFYRNDSQSGASNRLLKRMAEVTQKYCRHPLPDWYTIFLDVHPSRTTSVEKISCVERNKQEIGVVRCPDDYTEHDIYSYRSVNKKCTRLSQAGHLQSNPNSFLCTQNTPLLNKIFNKTIHEEFLSFPNDKTCVESSFQCNNCLNDNARCSKRKGRKTSSSCCGISCFSSTWCKNYFREECVSHPQECATGETMRFTLQPSFLTMDRDGFMCHVRYKPPKRLYRISYNVTILDAMGRPRWVSKLVSRDVTADGKAELHEDRAVHLDRIVVKHMTLMRLYPELILRGQQRPGNHKTNVYDFSAYQLRGAEDFEKGPIPVIKPHALSRMFYADVQVSRPFAVSTSSWINHWCYVNISNFHKNQTLYKPDGMRVEVERYRANFEPGKRTYDPKRKQMRPADPPPVQYFLRRQKFRPEIRFELKGTESILKPHFCRQHAFNRLRSIHQDLEVSLRYEDENRWSLFLNGLVNATPAYLHLRLTEARSRALILSHDAAIVGPVSKFSLNFSFLLPPVGGRRDADFDLALEDCVRTRHVFLASFAHRQLSRRRPKGTTARSGDLGRAMFPAEPSSPDSVAGSEDQGQPYFTLLLLTLAVGAVYLLLLIIYGVLRFCRRPHRYSHEELFPHHHRGQQGQQQQRVRRPPNALSTRRKVVLMAYLVFRVFYNFLFTFSAITSVIFSLQSVAMTTLESTASHQTALRDRFRVQFDNLEAFSSRELKRQVDFAQTLSGACNHVIGSSLGNTTSAMRRMSQQNLETTLLTGPYSIANQTRRTFQRSLVAYQQLIERFLDKHKHRMVNHLKVNYAPYGSLLRKVYSTPWLEFPQELFNKSRAFVDSLYDYALRPSSLKKVHVDFLTFLGISEAEKLHLMPTRLWKSLDSDLPAIPNELPPVPKAGKVPLWRSLKVTGGSDADSQSHSKRFFSTEDDQPLKRKENFFATPSKRPPRRGSPPHSKEITFDPRILSIRLFLLALDLLIVLYRFYHTYRTARVLYTGRRVRFTDAELISITHSNSATSFASVNTLLTSRESTPTASNTTAQVQASVVAGGLAETPLGGAGGLGPPEGEAGVPCLTSLRRSCFFSVHYLSVAATSGLALITLFCLIHADRTLFVPALLQRGGFLRRLDTLEASRRLVNQVIHSQAQHLNARVLPYLKRQSDEMSRRLVSLQYRFQHEQLHLNLLFHAESCSVDRSHCDASPRLRHTVESPVPTCNVIKVLADNFTEFMNPFSITNYGYFRDYQQIRRSLLADGSVMPEVGALRNLLFTSVVVLFTTLAAIGVLHLLGGLCLRWTHLPLRPIRVTKHRSSAASASASQAAAPAPAPAPAGLADASPLLRHQRNSAPTLSLGGNAPLTQESRV